MNEETPAFHGQNAGVPHLINTDTEPEGAPGQTDPSDRRDRDV